MTLVLIRGGLDHACEYCGRNRFARDSNHPAPKGSPDPDWVKHRLVQLCGDRLDQEVSFGTTGTVKLCMGCTKEALRLLDPQYILDFRDGVGVPSIKK